MIYSSKATGLFHDPDLGSLPDDAIEISPELHAYLVDNQSATHRINFDTDPPSLIERPPMPYEQLADIERIWREGQLMTTDGFVARHRDELESRVPTSLTTEQYSQLQLYRRQLRDWPQSLDFPQTDHRPLAPPWLDEQIR